MFNSRFGGFGIILILFFVLFCFVFNRISVVTKGIIELIEDDTKIGEILVVCETDGTKYKQFLDT